MAPAGAGATAVVVVVAAAAGAVVSDIAGPVEIGRAHV